MSTYQEKEKIDPAGEHIEFSSDRSPSDSGLEAASGINEKALIRKW